MRTCAECNSQLEEGWKLCPQCGDKAVGEEGHGTRGSDDQDIFLAPRATAGDISQVSGEALGTGKDGPGFQDIFIGPRASTGAITQIKNLNISTMSEEQFGELSAKLNLLLENAGIPGTARLRKRDTLTLEQREIAATIKEKMIQAEEHFGRTVGDPETLIRLGNMERLTGDLETAMRFYSRALDIYQLREDQSGVCLCHNLVGLIHHALREYDEAFGHFQKGLRIAEELDDKAGMVMSLRNMARVYFVRSEYEKALRVFLKSLGIRLKARKKKKQAG